MAAPMLVPELAVPDLSPAATTLRAFGFVPDAGLWRLGDQALRVAENPSQGSGIGHGRIDHLALSVPDMDSALAGLQAAGLHLDADITPNGPKLIPEFWDAGLRYVYLAGPDGARIELCQRLSGAGPKVGHDHIGIPCHDVAAMQRFFLGLGATPVASFALDRPDGQIPVHFLAFEGGVIELYQPSTPARTARGLWSRLLVRGLSAAVDGPEDLRLAPL